MREIVVVAVIGCGYPPGSYTDVTTPFPGKRVALGGCIDLSVSMIEDNRATGRVVQYSFGNGCWHAVTLDLASVRAYTTDGGNKRWLAAYDPKHELTALPLEAIWMSSERIEYGDGRSDPPSSICVDVGGVDAEVPRRERWVCLAQGELR